MEPVRQPAPFLRERDLRWEAEEALLKSQHRLKFLLTSSPAVVYTAQASKDFAITSVSENVKRLFGYEPWELTENPLFWSSHVHPDDLPRIVAELPKVLTQGHHGAEYRFRHRDGSYRWTYAELNLMRDNQGEPLEILGFWIDVSPMRQVTEELSAAQARIAHILESSPAMIYSLRVEGDRFETAWVSETIRPLLGYEPEEALDSSWWTSRLHPRDRETAVAAQRSLLEQGHLVHEYRFQKKDGSYLWLRDESRVVAWRDGLAVEVVGSWWDISDHRQAEEELTRARAEAERANRAKSDFLAHMSHELRTPLNAVIGFAEILADQTFGDLNAKQTQYADNILSSGRHLLALINDVLDLAKIEAERTELSLSQVDVGALLHDLAGSMSSIAEKKGVELAVTVDEDLPSLRADARRLKQILLNLLSNAIKFTPAGGCVLLRARGLPRETNEMDEVPPPMDASFFGACAWISVLDTGIGIRPEDQERLFQPFEQLSSSFWQQGTGLGLALVNKLVEIHGGRVWLESEGEGKGSAFHVLLPARGPRNE